MQIFLSGYATAKCSPGTVADLRELIAYLDQNGVDDSVVVDADMGTIWVLLTGDDTPGEWIECGEHRPKDGQPYPKDILLPVHDCGYQREIKWPSPPGPETWEEAEEERLDREKAAELTREGQDMAVYVEEEDEVIVCVACGISQEHEDFGVSATGRVNRVTGQWDYYCEPCAAEKAWHALPAYQYRASLNDWLLGRDDDWRGDDYSK